MSIEDAIGSHATGYYVVTRMSEGSYVDGEFVPAVAADDLSITAIDATLDTLTSAGHGLATGDGPFRLIDGRGQLGQEESPRLPSPLDIDTEYWAIVVDVDTLQLATSEANAIALTAIDLVAVVDSLPFTASANGFQIQASIQPIDGRDLTINESADRVYETRIALTEGELFTRKPGREPDEVEIDGEIWWAVNTERWQHWGTEHYETELWRGEIT